MPIITTRSNGPPFSSCSVARCASTGPMPVLSATTSMLAEPPGAHLDRAEVRLAQTERLDERTELGRHGAEHGDAGGGGHEPDS